MRKDHPNPPVHTRKLPEGGQDSRRPAASTRRHRGGVPRGPREGRAGSRQGLCRVRRARGLQDVSLHEAGVLHDGRAAAPAPVAERAGEPVARRHRRGSREASRHRCAAGHSEADVAFVAKSNGGAHVSDHGRRQIRGVLGKQYAQNAHSRVYPPRAGLHVGRRARHDGLRPAEEEEEEISILSRRRRRPRRELPNTAFLRGRGRFRGRRGDCRRLNVDDDLFRLVGGKAETDG
mmetsp:Transcript_8766/g.18896  ORF Transcript_8766/g.18896 Transcript_8766/m.18896 type:complete len:234 (-) Transcript_8766:1326-2027(-)